MDPLTSVGAGLAVIGSKDLLVKILGPTADYMGDELQGLVHKCNINLDNIFSIANLKLKTRINDSGSVNPRILKNIIDEGRFCENSLTAEYYGGILAASKNDDENDDRGITFLKQLESMSSFQIRFHYIIYYSIQNIFKKTGLNPGTSADCKKMKVFFPFELLHKIMCVDSSPAGWRIISHSAVGLKKMGLIENYRYGLIEDIINEYPKVDDKGFLITPNLSGAELFLWGAGVEGNSGHDFLELDEDFSNESFKPDIICKIVEG